MPHHISLNYLLSLFYRFNLLANSTVFKRSIVTFSVATISWALPRFLKYVPAGIIILKGVATF